MSTEITQNVPQSNEPPLNTEIDPTKIHDFHVVVTNWITQIHADFKNGNGYIKPNPKSICGEKFQELVEYMLTKSPELSNIRVQRRQAVTTVAKKIRRTVYFILESFLPVFISLSTMYLLYKMLTSYPTQSVTQQLTASPSWLKTVENVPIHLGNFVGKVLSMTGSFGSSVITSATGTPNFFNKLYASIITPLVGYLIYRLSQPISNIVQEARKTTEKQEQVFLLQDEFEAEYKAVLAQSLYLLFVLPVMNAFDQLLHMSSKSATPQNHIHIMRALDTYSENITILYHTFITQHEKAIRLMDPMDVLRISQPSAQFVTLMTRLIRESNDDLAQQYMLLNQSMLEAPRQMGQVLTLPSLPPTFMNDTLTLATSMRNILL